MCPRLLEPARTNEYVGNVNYLYLKILIIR